MNVSSYLACLWRGPSDLPRKLGLEWRLVCIRWIGVGLAAVGLPLVGLDVQRLLVAYLILAAAAAYNLAIHAFLPRRPSLFMSGYLTTSGDTLLHIAMISLAGFDSPLYYILYPITITAAMRYGYLPSMAMVASFVSFDFFSRVAAGQALDANLFFRSGFLVLTALLTSYLREQWRAASLLELYLPPGLTRELSLNGEVERSGREEELTILFADIRDYTSLTEKLMPSEAVAFLNEYFAVAVSPLLREGAVIDKFIGDGILAFFEGPRHAERALLAAHSTLVAIENFNGARPWKLPVRIGVAVHTGRVMVGTIGTPERREYTLISDAVNVTVRLEPINTRYGSGIVATDATLQAAGPEARRGFIGPQLVAVRGRRELLEVSYLPRTAVEPAVPPGATDRRHEDVTLLDRISEGDGALSDGGELAVPSGSRAASWPAGTFSGGRAPASPPLRRKDRVAPG